MFFKLHHAVADGVGGNAIFAAMTDWEAEPAAEPSGAEGLSSSKGAWPELPGFGGRVLAAMRDRVELDLERARHVAGHVVEAVQHPETVLRALEALRSLSTSLRFHSQSPLKQFGRSRRLSGVSVPFEDVRKVKTALGGTMIDVILTVMARAIGRWHKAHRLDDVRELMTLVPVNLRKPEEWAQNPHTGNVATGILVPLPIRLRGALATYREIRTRMAAKKADPASAASPFLAEVMSVLPRQFFTWMTEASFGTVDYIVTNVPGILAVRYLAGAEITAAYPFAPVAMKSPVSIALYGYRDQLFVGITSDETAMPDVDDFRKMILQSFDELRGAATRRSPAPSPRPKRRKTANL